MSLEQDFQYHILEQHQVGVRETGYKAPLFKSMVLEKGALQAAKDLLVGPTTISEGLTRLVLHKRLDLSLEANVIKPEWRSLFDKNELATAVERLTSLEFPVGPDIENYLAAHDKPERKSYEANRLIRDQGLSKKVKELYDYKCQICNIRLESGNYWYAEGAHIKALGEPHNGDDKLKNILCLCPNHHKLFDIGGLYMEDNLFIPQLEVSLYVVDAHNIDIESIQYHRDWCIENQIS